MWESSVRSNECNGPIGWDRVGRGPHTIPNPTPTTGQRGMFGRYCVHMHFMGECPHCLVKGNAIEFGMQRGIVVRQPEPEPEPPA